jgi:hypothetical protein
MPWKTVLILLIVCTFFVGCSTASLHHGSAPAIVPPQIDGNIQSIQAGDPSYVVLNNVQETDSTKHTIYKSEEMIKLPKGHFISPNHLQSDGETLDLFVGDDLVLMKETGQMIDITKSGDQFAWYRQVNKQ